MDTTGSNQEASNSPQDTARHVLDLLSKVSPPYYPLSSVRIVDSPEEEKAEAEEERESSDSETDSLHEALQQAFYINNDTCLNNYN